MKRIHTSWLCILVVFFLSVSYCSTSQQTKPDSSNPKLVQAHSTYALLVGISYKDSSLPVIPHSESDATKMKKALIKSGVPEENITLLLNHKATLFIILQEIKQLYSKANDDANGSTLFFFSGHGSPKFNDLASIEGGYLIPYNAHLTDLDRFAVDIDRDLVQIANRSNRPSYLFLDACFSGIPSENEPDGRGTLMEEGSKLVTGVMGKPKFLDNQTEEGSAPVFIMTATGSNQIAYSHPSQPNSMFSYYLIQSFESENLWNNEKPVTLSMMVNYIEKQVSAQAAIAEKEQTPTHAFNGVKPNHVMLSNVHVSKEHKIPKIPTYTSVSPSKHALGVGMWIGWALATPGIVLMVKAYSDKKLSIQKYNEYLVLRKVPAREFVSTMDKAIHFKDQYYHLLNATIISFGLSAITLFSSIIYSAVLKHKARATSGVTKAKKSKQVPSVQVNLFPIFSGVGLSVTQRF